MPAPNGKRKKGEALGFCRGESFFSDPWSRKRRKGATSAEKKGREFICYPFHREYVSSRGKGGGGEKG